MAGVPMNRRASAKPIGLIVMTRDAGRAINHMVKESVVLQSEVGGVACYEMSSDHAIINDVIPMREGLLGEDHFAVSPSVLKSNSRFLCSNDMPLFIHTHPSGQARLSSADVSFSKKHDAIICAVAGTEVRCNDGDRAIAVTTMNV